MHIRKLKSADVLALQQISRQTFLETFKDFNTSSDMQQYLDTAYATEKLAAELADPNTTFYFAEINAEPAGYIKLNTSAAQTELQNNNALEIERIYVQKAFQGKGIGQALYELALKKALQLKVNYIWLGVWEQNQNALRFYQKNGFTAFDQHIFILGSDQQRDIMMKRPLR